MQQQAPEPTYNHAIQFLVSDELRKEQERKTGPSAIESKAHKERREAFKQVVIKRMQENNWPFVEHQGVYLRLANAVKPKPCNPKIAASLFFQFINSELPRLIREGRLPAGGTEQAHKAHTFAFYKYVEAMLIQKGTKVLDLKATRKKPTSELVFSLEEL